MDKRDLRIMSAAGQGLGCEGQAVGFQFCKLALNIIRFKGNMVYARASLVQKATDLAAFSHGFNELYARVANRQKCYANAPVCKFLHTIALESKFFFKKIEALG